jgi:hypothetical protein
MASGDRVKALLAVKGDTAKAASVDILHAKEVHIQAAKGDTRLAAKAEAILVVKGATRPVKALQEAKEAIQAASGDTLPAKALQGKVVIRQALLAVRADIAKAEKGDIPHASAASSADRQGKADIHPDCQTTAADTTARCSVVNQAQDSLTSAQGS